MTEYPGSVQALQNLNTSDHVAVLLTLSSLTYVSTPPDRLAPLQTAWFINGRVLHGTDYIIILTPFIGIFPDQLMLRSPLLLLPLC